MSQPKLSILGFSSRQGFVTRFAHQRAVRRSLEASNRRPVTATIARIWHFLLDTNHPCLAQSKMAQLTENKGRGYFLLDTNGAILLDTNRTPIPACAGVASRQSHLSITESRP
jgi:hypothetical protein